MRARDGPKSGSFASTTTLATADVLGIGPYVSVKQTTVHSLRALRDVKKRSSIDAHAFPYHHHVQSSSHHNLLLVED